MRNKTSTQNIGFNTTFVSVQDKWSKHSFTCFGGFNTTFVSVQVSMQLISYKSIMFQYTKNLAGFNTTFVSVQAGDISAITKALNVSIQRLFQFKRW